MADSGSEMTERSGKVTFYLPELKEAGQYITREELRQALVKGDSNIANVTFSRVGILVTRKNARGSFDLACVEMIVPDKGLKVTKVDDDGGLVASAQPEDIESTVW